jgi:uncharacterized SAM-binding protein YcdF (DUF218 family)
MKNILYLIMPLSLVFFIFIFIFIKCKKKEIKKLIFLFLIIIYLFSTEIGTKILSNNNYTNIKDKSLLCDAVVILGGNVIERLFVSILLQKRFNTEIIVSGGIVLSNNLTEAEIYYEYLLSFGVQSTKIILEKNSRNTFENAKYTSKIIKENNYKNVCLVTSLSHINRSLWSFNQFNINIQPVFIENKRSTNIKSFMPNSKALYINTVYLKEYIGQLYYKLKYKGEL